MRTLSDVVKLLNIAIAELPLQKQPEGLYSPIKYILEDGGKRLRPLLLLLASEACGKDCSRFVNQAMAIEVFHNFTLLHDDIMDKAPIRRGRMTVHLKWNDNTAILSGDAMVFLSYRLLSEGIPSQHYAEVFEVFNDTALDVCEGQQLDMDFEAADDVSIDDYVKMIRLKTSVLLAASLQIGAILSDADAKTCDLIYKFGESLGIAFQIQDDLLDTYGDSSVFGKQIGGDIREGKKTFLRIQAFAAADEQQRNILMGSRDYNTVRSLYDILNVREKAMDSIERYFSIAIQYLEKCDLYDKSLLMDFAKNLVRRDR